MAPRRPIDEPTADDMLTAIMRLVLQAIGGVRIGIVQSYDPVGRTANVQPARRRRVWREPVDLPLVAQAPVGWWRFGGMVLAGELEPGDEVLLVTMAREVWPWYLKGGIVDPSSERMHDATDTLVLPWVSSLKRAITARLPRHFYLGREDGTAGISIPMDVPARIVVEGGPAGIVLGSAAVDTLVKYPAHAAAFAAWAGAMASAGATVAAPPNIPDPSGALYHAYVAAVTTATATLAGLIATPPAMGTVKTVAE